jgi:hypothetical protein
MKSPLSNELEEFVRIKILLLAETFLIVSVAKFEGELASAIGAARSSIIDCALTCKESEELKKIKRLR